MAFVKHSTAIPVKLSDELIARVSANHARILAECANIAQREATKDPRCAVAKTSMIPAWK